MFDLLASVISATESKAREPETVQSTPQAIVEAAPVRTMDPPVADVTIVPAPIPVVSSVIPEVLELPVLPPIPELPKLEIRSRAGDFVHNTQVMDTRFGNVSGEWVRKCMTFDAARERIAQNRGATHDVNLPFRRFEPTIIRNPDAQSEDDIQHAIALRDPDGAEYRLTQAALAKFYSMTNVGTTLPKNLLTGDDEDLSTLLAVLRNGWRHIDADKRGLIRMRDDGTIRAFLSEEYAIIDSEWFLGVVESVIPGGLVSHFRGDGDSVFFNVLIPDSLRAESDSQYGGMLACSNSEVGTGSLSTLPAVFRAICRNGCIWDRQDGIAMIKKRHRGEIDLAELASKIRHNLNAQIPLLSQCVDGMLALREFRTDQPIQNVLAAVIAETGKQVARADADRMLLAYAVEQSQTGVTAFDAIQAITRAAQEFTPAAQDSAEKLAGESLRWDGASWNRIFANAGAVSEKQLKSTFTKNALAS